MINVWSYSQILYVDMIELRTLIIWNTNQGLYWACTHMLSIDNDGVNYSTINIELVGT